MSLTSVRPRAIPAPPSTPPKVVSDNNVSNLPAADVNSVEENTRSRAGAFQIIRDMEVVQAFLDEHYVSDEHALANITAARQIRELRTETSSSFLFQRKADKIVAAQMQLEYATYCFLINQLLNEYVRIHGRGFCVCTMATKGGVGKTSIAGNIAIALASVGQGAVIIIETNENNGTLNFKLGLERDGHPLLTDAAKDPSTLDSHVKIISRLGKHAQVPVYALLSDPVSANYDGIGLREVVTLISEAERHALATVLDTGNGFDLNEAAVLKSDVVLIPILSGDETSISTALTTLINLSAEGHGKKLQEHTRIVVTGAKEGETVDQFLQAIIDDAPSVAKSSCIAEWVNDPTQMLRDLGFDYDEESESFTGEKIHLVQYSDWVHSKKPASFLPEDTGQQTINDLLKVIYSCLCMSVQTDKQKQAEIDRRLQEVDARDNKQKPSGDSLSLEGIDPDMAEALRLMASDDPIAREKGMVQMAFYNQTRTSE